VAQQLYDIKVGQAGRGEIDHDHDPPIRRRRKRNGNSKPMKFVSLHHHSTFSYKDGFQLPEAHVRRAAELNMNSLAMTEHGNISSHVKFEIAALKLGVKPIFGCELYTGKVGEGATQSKYHLTVLAKNEEGYHNLLKLVTKSWTDGFYYDPTCSWEMLNEHKRGLIILSGCQGSLLFCSCVGGKLIKPEDASYARGLEVARRFQRAFGNNYYLEVQAFPELSKSCEANPIIERIGRRLGISIVGTMDCHYTELEENEVQQILHNLRGGNKKTLEEQAREWGYDVPLCPPPNDISIYRRLRLTGLSKQAAIQAVVSTEEISQECNVTLPRLPMVRFPVPPGYRDAQQYWEEALKIGWRFRGFHKLPQAERDRAKAQLLHERKMIEGKDFIDYFLIIRMGVVHVKDVLKAPVGPARGSAAASLAAYLLRITEVDPMKFPLLVFERFIDMTREDLPDIDLDFPSEVRPLLRDYYVSIFGEGCVNNIGTFTYFKSKLALDDVARVYRIPKFRVERVKDFLIERSSGDLRASSTIEDTVAQFDQAREVFEEFPELRKSQLLEGNVKGFGVHAAGLVVSNHPITSVTAVHERTIDGNTMQVVALDKYDAERQGLVKMDFLGLSTMSVIWDCMKYLDWSLDDFYNLPLDDEKVYDAFRANDVVGVFQFDGRAMRYVCGSLKPDNFAEICDCNALARPGPLHNGAAREYAEIKFGNRIPQKIHPAVDRITAPTQYQIVYQEQILKIVREVGDFPWTHAAEIRKIIALKKGEAKFNESWDDFLAGSKTIHKRMDVPPMPEAIASDIWGQMITAGSYAFNAAHCVAYGMLANGTQYLKQHFPAPFYAYSLRHTPSKAHDLMRDAVRHGIEIRKPHPVRSSQSWKPVKKRKTIRAGFQQIHGVGPSLANAIVEQRDSGNIATWDDLLHIKGCGPKTVEKIKEWVERDDPFGAYKLDRDIRTTKQWLRSRSANGSAPLPFPTHAAVDLPFEQGVQFEVVWLGTILARNIRDIFETNRAKGREVDNATIRDPHLNEWAMLTCEDETDQLLLKIDRWKYPFMKETIFNFRQGKDLLLVEGVRPRYVTARQIAVKKMWIIEP
jgi:DNA polymerase III subunit alpha